MKIKMEIFNHKNFEGPKNGLTTERERERMLLPASFKNKSGTRP